MFQVLVFRHSGILEFRVLVQAEKAKDPCQSLRSSLYLFLILLSTELAYVGKYKLGISNQFVRRRIFFRLTGRRTEKVLLQDGGANTFMTSRENCPKILEV